MTRNCDLTAEQNGWTDHACAKHMEADDLLSAFDQICNELALLPPQEACVAPNTDTHAITGPSERGSTSDYFREYFSNDKEVGIKESAKKRDSSCDWIGEHLLGEGALLGEPGENDVILGRGGRGNNHIGNQRNLGPVADLKEHHRALSKHDKTKESQRLVDMVHAKGGRFVEQDKRTRTWAEVDNRRARRKVSQALREDPKPSKNTRKTRL